VGDETELLDPVQEELARFVAEHGDKIEEVKDSIPLTWDEAHEWLIREADAAGIYCGYPVPLDGYCLTLSRGHPLSRYAYEIFDLTDEGKARAEKRRRLAQQLLERGGGNEVVSFSCSSEDVDDTEWIRNAWWSRRLRRVVYLYEKRGKVHVSYGRRSDAQKLTMWVNTMGASKGWRIQAEREALTKLRELVPEHAADTYELTGSFFETSERSGVTYIFRKCRPTLALAPINRADENTKMQIIAALCMHPLGYYEGTWAGAMCPTDDVIAHLQLMRGDEHMYWRRANQHRFDLPEAGL
jgi:hypothetical protein